VGQYLVAFKWLLQDKPMSLRPSIVFMGQGEPLHNSAEVKKAIEVLNDRRCVGVGERQMTLSTVGHIPGIKELPKFPRINFALSLHSPFEEERTKLIPLNQKYPLDEVLLELDQVPLLKRQFITYEYLMIHNFNMSQRHADELAVKLSHRKAIINLIPFNPFPGSNWERPSSEEIESFKMMLVEKKLHVMLRTTKGHDILAACGQLKINKMARSYDRR
jgi:23S rRNA (adenine2503-C2)-methyltransferase